MSIPPLVCSTPPPPDQCDDDKDHEHFDLQYNLSQDDDDENYDYGNFATYNHFQSASESKKPDFESTVKVISNEEIDKIFENDKDLFQVKTVLENNKPDSESILKGISSNNTGKVLEEDKNDFESALRTNLISQPESKLEEDVIIEDLNLEIDQLSLEKSAEPVLKDNIESKTVTNNIDNGIEIDIQDANTVSQNNVSESVLQSDNYAIDCASFEHTEEIAKHVNDIIIDEQDDLTNNSSEFNVFPSNEVTLEEKQEPSKKDSSETINVSENELLEDFGDFDEFQVASTDCEPTKIITDCDNPWDVKESDSNDFGTFTANFETEGSLQVEPQTSIDPRDDFKEIVSAFNTDNLSEDDDFGDFDDFKSSEVKTSGDLETDESVSFSQTPLLRLSSLDDDSQLMENVNKVINDMFEYEIPEPESKFDGKLEVVLGETWGHLLETDVRQPYMVNWNNSVGQKTLLKALCIDSRNILFGPKWSYNMPKYAANLSAAPLQPQKQPSASTSSHSESLNPDKSSNNPATTWTDPFTSDGQESCNADTGGETAAIETGPTDLDVFEASTSSKPDKIYSSTLNVQPLRHINLPDTHIFTPIDSETPRSKTIHYETGSTVLLPQAVLESNKNPSDVAVTPTSSTVVANLDDDYWEFQDFKGTSDTAQIDAIQATAETNESATPKTITNTTATQVLQPIKMDPIIPTLNWPDPGEVKETFDDFSDFVSNLSWNEKLDTPTTPTAQPGNNNFILKSATPSSTAISQPAPNEAISSTTDGFDDEFDTFQSALPSKTSLKFGLTNINKNSLPIVEKVALPNTIPEMTVFDNVIPKDNSFNSDTISFPSTSKTKDLLPINIDSAPKAEVQLDRNVPLKSSIQINNTSILQPTHASINATAQGKSKSNQILQPLSLESFSQINWPNPGIDLQDLSRFNPVETLQSLKSDLSTNSHSKVASPVHNQKGSTNQPDDDWGEFVSSKPKPHQPLPKKTPVFADDDEWTDFVSSPSVKPQNGLNTISLNVHTNLNNQKSSNTNKFSMKVNQVDIPSLNYITPKSSSHKTYNDRHFQNL